MYPQKSIGPVKVSKWPSPFVIINSRTARYLLKFQRPIMEILIKFIAKITEKRNPKTSPNGLKHKNIKTEFFLTILYFSDYQKFEFRES